MTPYYQHAGITIYHGDCREILPTLSKVDLVLTDPPYGIGKKQQRIDSRKHGGLGEAWTDYGHFDWDEEPASDEEITLTMAAGRRAIIWGGNYFKVPPSRGWLVWDKVNSASFADCELAWTNLPQAVRLFRHMWNGMLRASENDCKRVHPTQKPIALMKWCLSFAPDAETVIDPFCGSGSVLVAAKARQLFELISATLLVPHHLSRFEMW